MAPSSGPHRAPQEPDIRVGAVDPATVESVRWRGEQLEPGYDFSSAATLASPSIEGSTPDTGPRQAKSKLLTPEESSHPVLEALEAEANAGQPMRALAGYRRLAAAVADLEDVSTDNLIAGVGAMRRAIETAVSSDLPETAAADISTLVPRWQQSGSWQKLRRQLSKHLERLIMMELRMGRGEAAIEAFEKARSLADVDDDVRWRLALAAAEMGKSDIGLAPLYIDFLDRAGGDADECEKVLVMLRRGLRITLLSPHDDDLSRHRKLNDQLWEVRAVAWCAAHRAHAALRLNRLAEALEIREAVPDLEQADADALVALTAVSIRGQRWEDALLLLDKAQRRRDGQPGLEALYTPLAHLGHALAVGPEPTSQDTFVEQLAQHAETAQGALRRNAEDLDAAWLIGAGHFLAGQDAPAQQQFRSAPLDLTRWQYLLFEIESLHRVDRPQAAQERLRYLEKQQPHAASAARLLLAREALLEADLQTARGMVEAVQVSQRANDTDLAPVRGCLENELRQWNPAPREDRPLPPEGIGQATAAVRGWQQRLECHWLIEQGEWPSASQMLDDPLQWIGPDRDVHRVRAAGLALLGVNEDMAERLLEHLGASPAARHVDRLAWALWLCGRNAHPQAQEVLFELNEKLPDCLELRLARAESALATAEDEDLSAVQAILDDPTQPPLNELSLWKNAPRVSLYRPWQRWIPPNDWSHTPEHVSMHRIGDMLQAANLLARADRTTLAMEVVALIERFMGTLCSVVRQQLGELLRQACVAEIGRLEFEQACRLHAKASEFDGGDPTFAVQLAEATRSVEATPPDVVLETFVEWLGANAADANRLTETEVGQAVNRMLFVDELTPEAPGELDRRQIWCEKVLQVTPAWDWPKQNLARWAARVGKHSEVLQYLDTVTDLQASDHVLRGHASWQLESYDVALDSFTRAMAAGAAQPDLPTWRGCAQAAVRFRQLAQDEQPLARADAEKLLADLACDLEEPALVQRAAVWSAAVLLASGQGAQSAEVFSQHPEFVEEHQLPAKAIHGAALMMVGQLDEALALWQDGDDSLQADPLMLATGLLGRLRLQRFAADQQVRPVWDELRKRAATTQPFHLATAELAIARDELDQVKQSLQQAQAAAETPLPVLFAPLQQLFRWEQRFVAARLLALNGQFGEAGAALQQLPLCLFWPGLPEFWQATCLANAGDVAEAENALQSVLESDSMVAADCHAQLALIRVRSGRIDEAGRDVEASLADEPAHPFARLAKAEIQESEGDTAAANGTLTAIAQGPAPTRLMAAAELRLGRLAQTAADDTAAEEHFRRALELRPKWQLAQKRLALLLAQQPASADEAMDLLGQVCAAAPHDVPAHLFAAKLHHDAQRWSEAADCLAATVRSPGFAQVSAAVRQQVALWSVDLQLMNGKFGAAAAALAQIEQDSPSPEVQDRLVQCLLLQAVERLRTVPLLDHEIDEATQAADEVVRRIPDHALALLLAVLCRVLRHRQKEASAGKLLAKLGRQTFPEPRLQLLSGIVQHLSGDESALQGTDSLLASLEDGAAGEAVRLLVANGKLEKKALVEAGLKLVQAIQQGAVPQLPFDQDDLVEIAGLECLAENKRQMAVDTFKTWVDAGFGNGRVRLHCSQLLAQQAVARLRARDVTQSRRLLADAVSALETAQAIPAAESNGN